MIQKEVIDGMSRAEKARIIQYLVKD
jgi:hypothetical protein